MSSKKSAFEFGPKHRLVATIVISFAFFVSELAVAFKTRSLALMADAFHYMNDLIGFIVALTAIIISERSESPQDLSFGWQRARLLGAFFNGVFLLALGISIFLQSIERFISLQMVEDPKLVLIMGSVGLGLNLISAAFLHVEHHGHDHHGHGHDHGHAHGHAHGHDQSQSDVVEDVDRPAPTTIVMGVMGHHPEHNGSDDSSRASLHSHAEHRHAEYGGTKSIGRDLGMMGATIHVMGDALNNLGVIIAAAIIWFTHSPSRFYADPGVSMGIALMILVSALPLVKNSGAILLQSAPRGVDLGDVKHDLEKIPGIESVHELHVWRLDQKKAIASAHVVVSDQNISNFMEKAKTVSECLHAYGIHSATLQPEFLPTTTSLPPPAAALSATTTPSPAAGGVGSAERNAVNVPITSTSTSSMSPVRRRRAAGGSAACQMVCGKGICENLFCCTAVQI
ncbi:cation efflux family-domain-containing protein [Lasiosphaeria miniovina]|uniref:Cation efflux family-domain-containing protein n=1 Tax=Lasiosphaeria miniovina TaxID=1954250 RepID=A0AA40AUH5_9PEZI|nr:cation efflux family-domain-containing protein [Lasiosphaeria miniovina]KAK0722187.1 cation efflux family-domain-containing protein [Lasiosphaeria miniovina]